MTEPRPALRAPTWPWFLGTVAMSGFAVAVVHAWPFTVDDTYITLRYSRNVAEGLGPTFNATGARAEGYTTFAWMMMLAIPHALGLGALAAAKALGVAASVATLLVAARWARREGLVATGDPEAGVWAAATAVLCLASIPATAIHAVSGMETAFFTLLLTSLFAAAADVVRGRGAPAALATRLALVGLLAGLTRPEGNLAVFLVTGAAAVLSPPASRRGLLVRTALGWALPIGVYELWRHAYYGLWFPLPFYVKLASPGMLPGLLDVLGWLRSPVLHFAPLVALGLVRPARSLWPALGALGALVVFFVLPQHQMGYDHRYLAPLDPTVAVVGAVGVARLVRWGHSRSQIVSKLTIRSGALLAGAAAVAGAGLEAIDAPAVIAGEADYGRGLENAHARLGRDLRALAAPNARLVISDAGAVPYLSRWWTLDLVGLNDATVATTGRREPAWVLAQKPDVLVFASPRTDRVEAYDWNPWEPALYDACVARGFARVALERFADDYWLWVMAMPDMEIGKQLVQMDESRRAEHTGR